MEALDPLPGRERGSLHFSRSLAWLPTMAVVAVVAVATAVVISFLPQLPQPVGPNVSVSPSIDQSPPSSATRAPSTTPIQRAGWTSIRVAEPNPYAGIAGIADGEGMVLAFGRADIHRLGVWRSFDGQTWEAGSIPELPTEFGGALVDVAVTEDGFVGLAQLGNPEGSEPYNSALYTSPDGSVWKAASAPVEGNWIGTAIAVVGSRIVVAASTGDYGEETGVFVSDDNGASWQRTTDIAALGGQITDLVADGARLVAVGHAGGLGTEQPLLWESTDGGATWNRTRLGDVGRPSDVVVGPGKTIVVFGSLPVDAVVWVLEGDGWTARRVASRCFAGATNTPTGYVAAVLQVQFPSTSYVVRSTDAREWKLEEPGVGVLTGVRWTDDLGLLTSTPLDIVLGPAPYP